MKLFSKSYSRFEEIPISKRLNEAVLKTSTHKKIEKLHLNDDQRKNILITLFIFIIALLISVAYFTGLSIFFNQMWYHKLFNVFSSVLLFYMVVDISLFYYQKKAIDQLPIVVENIINFYQVNQNMSYAFEQTKKFFPNYKYLDEIMIAFRDEREANLPSVWHHTLFFIYKESCLKGTADDLKDDKYAKSLETLVFNLMDIKSEQELDNASLLSFQMFAFFAPYAVIIASDWFNGKLMAEMHLSTQIDPMQKMSIGTQLILVGNLGTVFINWMRKVVAL